ncbi:hypothetical protein K7X08_032806 [Anisodus acutangulus]|uniref:H15 domain-containing protein n=1 Tax=Anisodus acutangulus TaxID=402998 RepID=A0A9Q1M0E7_9SOLA|nr:hypothetical protein K7X08_032806 [Anisodus acutangulus]
MASATATAKKTTAPKKPRSHPPYAEMISEAIIVLKERTGSSQVAIAKFIEEKQKDLPSNFRKLLLIQLKKLVASGKLTKIKGSFKHSPVAGPAKPKKAAAGAAKPKAVTPKKKAKARATTPVKKAVTAPAKSKKATPVKKVAVAKVKTPAKKPKTIKAPAKSKKATPVAKVKKTPTKKPKTIKAPAKKAKK